MRACLRLAVIALLLAVSACSAFIRNYETGNDPACHSP